MAQGTGSIEGSIVNGELGVGGVAVQVVQTNAIAIADEKGRFVIEGLAPGSYTLIFSSGEEQTTRIVTVAAGAPTALVVEVDWTVAGFEQVKVTAGLERAGKIVDAPAAVTRISDEQIEREASHGQLPKVLEYTPGAEITQSGLYDFNFNTRGFNSSLNRRVSTYIDGRDVGVPLLGAQEWAALSIPLDDLASLEFIRGPAAALYGANASSGVINMKTKSPRDTQGGMVRTAGGELNSLSTDIRWADGLGKNWFYKVVAGFRASGDFTISRDPNGPDRMPNTADDLLAPEYSTFCESLLEAEEPSELANCLFRERGLLREDDNDIQFGTLRVDKYLRDGSRLTLESGTTRIQGPVFQTGIGRVQIVDAQRPWARFGFAHPHWNVLAHWAHRDGEQVNLNKALVVEGDGDPQPPSIDALLAGDPGLVSDTIRYGLEMQTNWDFALGKGRIVAGAAYTEEIVDSRNPRNGEQTILVHKIESDRQALFSQFDWKFSDHFKAVVAGRVDWNTLHDTQFSPKAAVVYTINPKHSIRATYNEAFQVANYSEFFLETRFAHFPLGPFAVQVCFCQGIVDNCGIPLPENFNPVTACFQTSQGAFDIPILAVGNDDLELEETQSWEVGYSAILANKLFMTLDYYNSRNQNFITDLIAQNGTSLGSPINPDYVTWTGTDLSEQDIICDPIDPLNCVSAADQLRGIVNASVGGIGLQLNEDFDGNPVIVARTYANVGKVETQGFDLGINLFLTDALTVLASYSWFDFEIIDAPSDIQEILLPNTPEHKASASISFSKPRWDVSVSGRWVDEFPWAAGVFQGNVPAYWTADLAAGWSIRKWVRLGVNVANPTDNVHRQTFGGDLLGRRALAHATFYWE